MALNGLRMTVLATNRYIHSSRLARSHPHMGITSHRHCSTITLERQQLATGGDRGPLGFSYSKTAAYPLANRLTSQTKPVIFSHLVL